MSLITGATDIVPEVVNVTLDDPHTYVWPFFPPQSREALTPVFRELGVPDEEIIKARVLIGQPEEKVQPDASTAVVDVEMLNDGLRSKFLDQRKQLGRMSYNQFVAGLDGFRTVSACMVVHAVATSALMRETEAFEMPNQERGLRCSRIFGAISGRSRIVTPAETATSLTKSLHAQRKDLFDELGKVLLPRHNEYVNDILTGYAIYDEQRHCPARAMPFAM